MVKGTQEQMRVEGSEFLAPLPTRSLRFPAYYFHYYFPVFFF